MNTLSIGRLATLNDHPILRNVFHDIAQQLALQGKDVLSLSADQVAQMQWSGGQWSGAQWSGAQWSGGQWSGAQWSGGDWSGDN